MPRFWPFLIQFSINSSQIYLKCNLRHMVWLAKLVVAQLEVAKWTNKCSKCWLFWECPLMHFKSCLKWVQFPGMGDSGVNTTQRSPKSGFSSLCKATRYGGVKREKEKEKTRGFPPGDTASCFYFSSCWNVRATVEQKEKRRDVTQIFAKRGSSSWWIRDVYRTYNTNPVFPACFYSKSRGV